MASRELRAEQVDPRDVRVENETPVYRVYFEDQGGATDEYRLTGASDVGDALDWGTQHADGRAFHLFVETEAMSGRRLDLIATRR